MAAPQKVIKVTNKQRAPSGRKKRRLNNLKRSAAGQRHKMEENKAAAAL